MRNTYSIWSENLKAIDFQGDLFIHRWASEILIELSLDVNAVLFYLSQQCMNTCY